MSDVVCRCPRPRRPVPVPVPTAPTPRAGPRTPEHGGRGHSFHTESDIIPSPIIVCKRHCCGRRKCLPGIRHLTSGSLTLSAGVSETASSGRRPTARLCLAWLCHTTCILAQTEYPMARHLSSPLQSHHGVGCTYFGTIFSGLHVGCRRPGTGQLAHRNWW